MPRCPRGHDTAAADYCDECGSPLSVLVSPAAASPASTGDGPHPECEMAQTGRFCEHAVKTTKSAGPPRH